MNQRERILMIIVVVGAVLVGGSRGYKMYQDALDGLDKDISNAGEKLEELEKEKSEAEDALRDWRRMARKTFSTDETDVKNALSEEFHQMVAAAGFRDAEVRPQSGARNFGKSKGVERFPCKVTGEATIEQILKFFQDLERQPYLTRVTGFVIKPVRQSNRRGATTVPDLMSFEVDIETPMLQDTDLVDASELKTIKLKDRAEREYKKPDWRFESFEAYTKMFHKGLFEPYVAPVAERVVMEAPTNREKFTDGVKPGELRWKPAAHATRYELFVSDQGAPKPTDKKALSSPTATSWNTAPLAMQPGKTYWWRVDSVNEENKTTSGQVWTFSLVKKQEPTGPIDPGPEKQPPPADQNLIVQRIGSGPERQWVALVNNLQNATNTTYKEVGESMYKGELVLVHPRGIVTYDERGDQLLVHPMKTALKDGKPLTEADYPEIYDYWQELQRDLAGISRR